MGRKRATIAAVVWVALWGGAACVRWGFDPRPTSADAAPESGSGDFDGHPPIDGSAATDLAQVDGSPTPDGPLDGRTRDAAHPPDIPGYEGAIPDIEWPTDGPLSDLWANICGSQATLEGIYAVTKFVLPVYVCKSTTGPVNQCNAASLCGGSMRLAPSSAFIVNVGSSQYVGIDAWMGGRISRENNKFSSVYPAPCDSCAVDSAPDTESAAFDCNDRSVLLSSDAMHLGVHSSATCAILGVANGTEAYWYASPPGTLLDGAICSW